MADQFLPERVANDQLFDLLAKTPSTGLWDYVASYSLERLNPFLTHTWSQAKTKSLEQKFTVFDEPVAETLDFEVIHSFSQLQFKIDRCVAYAVISLNISGTYTIRQTPINEKLGYKPRVVPIPPEVRIVLTVPSGSIAGSAIKDSAVAEKLILNQDQGLCFWFSDKTYQPNDGAVVLDFGNSVDTTWDIVVPQHGKDIFGFESTVAPKLQAWLQSTEGLSVRCARPYDLETGESPTPHDVCLPTSFGFAATGFDKTSNGVISVLVQCKGSGNGPGVNPLRLQGLREAIKVCPLPSDKTASVLFNRYTFTSKILEPSLNQAASSPDKKAPVSISPETGFAYNLFPFKDQPDTWNGMWKDNQRLQGYTSDMYKENLHPDNTAYKFTWDAKSNKASLLYQATDAQKKNFVLDIKMNKELTTFGTLSNQFIASFLEIKIEDTDFVMWVPDPPWISATWDPNDVNKLGWRTTMRDFPKFTFQLPVLDFSPLHRLLSPVVAASLTVSADTAFRSPFDLLMVGELASVEAQPLPQPASQAEVGIPVAQRFKLVAGEAPAKYFDPFFQDSALLSVFFGTMATEPAWKLKSLAASANLDFPPKDASNVGSALAVGASFDPRLITGTYGFTEPEKACNWTIFIDTIADKPRVYGQSSAIFNIKIERILLTYLAVNNMLAGEVQLRNSDSHISFTYDKGPLKFILTFEFPLGDINDPIRFSGVMMLEETSRPVAGVKVVSLAYAGLIPDKSGFKALIYTASMYGLLGALSHVCYAGEQFLGGGRDKANKTRSVPRYTRLSRTLAAFHSLSSGMAEQLDKYVDRGHVVELDDLFVGSEEAYEIDSDTQALKEWNFGQRKEFEITGDILSARTELQKNAEAVQKVEAEREAVAETKFTIRRPQKKSALAHMENARNPAIVVDRSGHSHVILDGTVYSSEPIDNPGKEEDILDDPVIQEFKKELDRVCPDGSLSQEVPSHGTSEFVQKQTDSTVRQRADILPRMEAMQNIANDPTVRQESSRFKQTKDNITKAGFKVKEIRK